MLGEAFLHIMKHRKEHACLAERSAPSHTLSHAIAPPELLMPSLSYRSSLTPQTQQVENSAKACWAEGPEKPGPCLTSAHSKALTIPSYSTEDHLGMQLYHSWCPSFCKAYPDLQLAGGTLGPHPTLSPLSQNPFLQSQDLGSLEALEELGQQVEVQPEPDEGYLVIESMQNPGSDQRLTNSMLNGYLETQLMEVYRQHMQDSLARYSTSLTSSVMPTLVPTNHSMRDGQAGGQGEGLDTGPAHNSVRYLSTCSAPP
ncbi:hypothetical protein P4O66_015917, partial [Electrophorus voltai]